MELVMPRRGAVEERRGRSAAEAVALMRSLGVIEAHELGQTPRERRQAGEVAATKLDPPVFLENGALQALDEPVRPRMARLGARVPEAELPAGVIERPLELAAGVRVCCRPGSSVDPPTVVPCQGVVTLGTIGQMALFFSSLKCQHYYDSGHARDSVSAGATCLETPNPTEGACNVCEKSSGEKL